MSNYNRFKTNGRATFRSETEQKAKILEQSLADKSAFPELSSKPINSIAPTAQLNFLDTIKNAKIDTNEIVLPKKPQTSTKRRDATPYEIFTVLNRKYEQWKENYIKEFGEYEYERDFRFPNYDYEYFDKLDEKYEKELQELEEKEKDHQEAENADHEQYMDYLNDVSYD